MVDVKRWLSYKGTCHVILQAKLHDMYLYKTDNFFHINRYLKSVSKVAVLHRFYCNQNTILYTASVIYVLHITEGYKLVKSGEDYFKVISMAPPWNWTANSAGMDSQFSALWKLTAYKSMWGLGHTKFSSLCEHMRNESISFGLTSCWWSMVVISGQLHRAQIFLKAAYK